MSRRRLRRSAVGRGRGVPSLQYHQSACRMYTTCPWCGSFMAWPDGPSACLRCRHRTDVGRALCDCGRGGCPPFAPYEYAFVRALRRFGRWLVRWEGDHRGRYAA